MFIILKRRHIAIVLTTLMAAELILTVFLCSKLFSTADNAVIDYTVVIDAGHGGVDGGVVGVSGVKESDLNIMYAKRLGKIFQQCCFRVVYTRTDSGGLYGLPTKGFKRRDMEKRREIIENASPNLVVSVHMNKFTESWRTGPQAFYQKGNEQGQQLAESLQTVFNNFTGNSHSAIGGDYFICRTSDCPSVIVECGFLSNPAEEQLLQTESYCDELCAKIFDGIMLYLYS